MRRIASICLPLLLPLFLTAQPVRQVRLSRFTLLSSAVVAAAGDSISSPHYTPKNYWFPVTVPCTVLTGLVENKVYADPYIGMNNMLIPDANDSFNRQYHLEKYSYLPGEPNPWKKPYWYRTTFSVPSSDKGRHFQLIFKGINYRAEVWLNSSLLIDSSRMVGMFKEFDLDATAAIHAGGENVLAVKIYPLDDPGLPSTPQLKALGDFFPNGGPTGDIGKNVTMLSSIGWDWIPEVHDRNIGIWQPVYLRTTGQVTITKPQIITDLPNLPDTSLAKLSLELELDNHDARAGHGTLQVTITPDNFTSGQPITFTKVLTLDANGAATVKFTAADIPALLIRRPRLWWPNGYGDPNLYRLRLRFTTAAGISDDTAIVFGIRNVSSRATDVNGFTRRDFFVNGRRIHLDGGAWVPDMMLNRDRRRYDYELRLCRNANVNIVRIWGGGLGETDDFYELADRYGLLVWQDFWITGDTNGGFKGSADWPVQSRVFIDNVENTIYRIRNHPSLLVWTGGNEGHARKELYDAMRDNVATLDGTRPFIPCSSGFSHAPKDWKGSWPDNQPAGVYSGGPYSWQDDAQYYRLVDGKRDWVFKDETGIPSQPPYNTLSKIIPDLVPDPDLPYPLNNTWGYHDACTGNGHYDTYYQAMLDRFGAPVSMRDFSDKMQLLNAGGYRSIFEAAGHKLNETGGVMLWKLNAAFPSVIWQVYDWYLEPNSGYYFMKRACEAVHIQLNLDDSAVAVVNRTYIKRPNLQYDAEVVGMTGSSLFKQKGRISLDTTDVKEVLSLRDILGNTSGISFVLLSLKDESGKTISHNVYWMSPGHNFADLRAMPSATVRTTVMAVEKEDGFTGWTLQFTNTATRLAFFLNPQIIGSNGEEILPSYWSDNYFSIPAGGSVTVKVSCPAPGTTKPQTLRLRLEGWNIRPTTQPLTKE
ncbi:MAG TPA: glycoside hydrolase family 2 TIM barrel-domain containing protein [Puia sp.]|nr:glycoside hydrolase family 2 TIM barrel-domain containing protein [Puia sp.]